MNMTKIKINEYALEIRLIVIVFVGILLIYSSFSFVPGVGNNKIWLAAITNAGLLFLSGHIYAKLKALKDQKKVRAHDLFLEWHSRDVRESRIFVSHWRMINGTNRDVLPLSNIENIATESYQSRYTNNIVLAHSIHQSAIPIDPREIDNPELVELHFFRIYQFFERWALLVANNDIDHARANRYLRSYKSWYLDNFIVPWSTCETDEYIKGSLVMIVDKVSPD